MSNASKQRGTAWESQVVEYLRRWNPNVERRALGGTHDRGDVAGIVGVVIEAKCVKTVTLGTFVDEAETERVNDDADLGLVWLKRRGRSSAGDAFVVMTGATAVKLLIDAGYLPDEVAR